KKEVKLIDWWWRGQPAIDAVFGQLSVGRKELGEVIRDLYAGKLQPNIRVFPKGIPVPIDYLVELRLGEAAHTGLGRHGSRRSVPRPATSPDPVLYPPVPALLLIVRPWRTW